ncbi:MAG: hypothetical protein VYD72_03235 [Chloroflexota bacterium]|nr:hypothetical protein [Chloroflexota bacterium]
MERSIQEIKSDRRGKNAKKAANKAASSAKSSAKKAASGKKK